MGNELTREQQRKQDQLTRAQNQILRELERLRLATEQENRSQGNTRSFEGDAGARQGAAHSTASTVSAACYNVGGGRRMPPPAPAPAPAPAPSAPASFAFSRPAVPGPIRNDVTTGGRPSNQAAFNNAQRLPRPPGTTASRASFVPPQPSAPLLVTTPDPSLSERRSPQRYSYSQGNLDAPRQNLYPELKELGGRPADPAGARDFVFVNRDGSADTGGSRNEDDSLPTCACCGGRLRGAPIYQCSGGHSGCEACRAAGRPCTRCYRPLTDMRSFAVEALIVQMKYPCPNAAHGCKRTLAADEEERHVRECSFGEVLCPAPPDRRTCFWTGRVNELAQHFTRTHPERCAAVDSERTLSGAELRAPDRHLLYLLTVGVYAFELHVEVRDGALALSVRMMGTRASASKWTYEVHVYNKAEPRRKYLYADACAPAAAPDRPPAARLPAPYLATFLNRDQLVYKVFVKKTDCESERDRSADRRPFRNRRPHKRNES